MYTETWTRQSNPPAGEDADLQTRIASYHTAPSLASGPLKGSMNKGRESGFRATMSKLFGGSKKKRITVVEARPREV